MSRHFTSKLVTTFLLLFLASCICLAQPARSEEPADPVPANDSERLLYLTVYLRDGEVISFDHDSWDKRRYNGAFGLISYEQLKLWKEKQWIVEWPTITGLVYSIDLINTNLERYDRDKIIVTGQNGEQAAVTWGGFSYGDPGGTCCPEYFIYQEYNELIKKWVDIHIPIKHIKRIVLGTTHLMVNPNNCRKFPPDYKFDPADGTPLVFYTHTDAKIKCEDDPEALKKMLEELQRERDRFEECCKRLQAELDDEIARHEADVKKCKEGVSVTVKGRVLFEFGKADLTPEGKAILNKIGKQLQKMGDRKISVIGHTDNVRISPEHRHIYPTNLELSVARAVAVVHYFEQEHGIDPTLMEATGRSYHEPVASNATAEGRDQNRRVEIVVH